METTSLSTHEGQAGRTFSSVKNLPNGSTLNLISSARKRALRRRASRAFWG